MTGFVYKWTNTVNGKWYIGSHKGSIDDGYVASGVLIRQAFEKHGRNNFIREILYKGSDYRIEEEKLLLETNAAQNQMSYNMINTASDIQPPTHYGDDNPAKRPEIRKKISDGKKGKTLGRDNAQFGTKWINKNGEIFKVKKEEVKIHLQNGWRLGRRPLTDEERSKISSKLKGRESPFRGKRYRAQMRGDRYYVGGPCKNKHNSLRYTKTSNCIECLRSEAKIFKSRGIRQEVIKNNQPTYFTNLPCKRGHLSLRSTRNGACIECEKLGQINRRKKKNGQKF